MSEQILRVDPFDLEQAIEFMRLALLALPLGEGTEHEEYLEQIHQFLGAMINGLAKVADKSHE